MFYSNLMFFLHIFIKQLFFYGKLENIFLHVCRFICGRVQKIAQLAKCKKLDVCQCGGDFRKKWIRWKFYTFFFASIFVGLINVWNHWRICVAKFLINALATSSKISCTYLVVKEFVTFSPKSARIEKKKYNGTPTMWVCSSRLSSQHFSVRWCSSFSLENIS